MPSLQPPTISELPMLLRASPRIAVGDLVQVLVAVLRHGQHIGQDLGGMQLVGQTVPDRHTRELGQGLDVAWAKPRYSMPS